MCDQRSSTDLQIGETKIAEQKREASQMETEIAALQEDLMRTVDDITSLEARRTEMDERRKYIIETGNITLEGRSSELINDSRVKDAYLGGDL